MPDKTVTSDIETEGTNEHAINGRMDPFDWLYIDPNIRVTATGAGADGIFVDFSARGIIVRTGAAISSTHATGINLMGGNGFHTVKIDPLASVSGSIAGVLIAGSSNSLVNAGTITGEVGAILGGPGSGADNHIDQSGVIRGDDVGIRLFADTLVNNTGLIEGGTTGIVSAPTARALTINNMGTIKGGDSAIVSTTARAFITNSGVILGNIYLGGKDDLYDGRNGSVVGTIWLGSGNDRAFGGAGFEQFNGGIGNDTIDGGGGNDMALYAGLKSDYRITHNANGSVTITDTGMGGDGVDTLRNVRFARFLDDEQTVTLHNAAPVDLVLSQTAFAEDTPVTGIVARLSARDADGDALTYSLVDNPGGRFKLDGLNLLLAQAVDFETATQHSVTVKARDAYGGEVTKTFDLSVTNVVETNPLVLRGTPGNDRLTGEAGSDTFYGGLGRDILTGGLGQDIFVFDTKPHKRTNLDTITDFNVRDDTIHLAKKVFSKITKKGVLQKSAFWSGAEAHDSSDRIIYNKKTGALFYDQDGNGAKAAIQFATLSKNLKMGASDFFVM